MDALQAFLLGIMAGWTPCLVLLAWMLRRDFALENRQGDLQH